MKCPQCNCTWDGDSPACWSCGYIRPTTAAEFIERTNIVRDEFNAWIKADPVSAYLSTIGKKGGSRSSPRKTEANRLKAVKRWADVKAKKEDK